MRNFSINAGIDNIQDNKGINSTMGKNSLAQTINKDNDGNEASMVGTIPFKIASYEDIYGSTILAFVVGNRGSSVIWYSTVEHLYRTPTHDFPFNVMDGHEDNHPSSS